MAPARALAKTLGIVHNISYYSRETKAFADVGIPEFWRAYMAYRLAPLGEVGPAAGAAALYNFAPAMVAEALPSVWDAVSPDDAIALRNVCMDRALRRALGDLVDSPEVAEAATLAERGIAETATVGRVLFGGHMDLAWPTEPHMRLWHACTLWREHRGDSHNIALAAAEIDGLECHVLLAAKGVATADVIEKIRGWTGAEWQAAQQRLTDRELLRADGSFTAAGKNRRDEVELHTDALCAGPRRRLGPADTGRLIELVSPIATHLVATGAVAGKWPPDNPISRTTHH